MNIIVFEDQRIGNLAPFSAFHTSAELLVGAKTLLDRITGMLDNSDQLVLLVRAQLAEVVKERFPKCLVNPPEIPSGWWLNGACIWSKSKLKGLDPGILYKLNDIPVAWNSPRTVTGKVVFADLVKKTKSFPNELDRIDYLWDAFSLSGPVMQKECREIPFSMEGTIHSHAFIDGHGYVSIGPNVRINAGVMIEAAKGPVIIDRDVRLDLGAMIQGPVYIGPHCIVNPGARLRGNVFLGPNCRVGGELNDVIMQGYCNKQHDGFLGHSFLSEWVNLGADTTVSNLKNTYGNISVEFSTGKVNTERLFLGSLIGDFVRTQIGTLITTGSIIEIGANVMTNGLTKKHIPPFAWGERERTELYRFLETARLIKSRRGKQLTDAEYELLTRLFNKS